MSASKLPPAFQTRLVDAMNLNPGDRILIGSCVYVLMLTREMGKLWVQMYFTEEDNKSENTDLVLMMPIDRDIEVLRE